MSDKVFKFGSGRLTFIPLGRMGRAGIDGVDGVSPPAPIYQWSINGTTGWHSPYALGDVYMRISIDGGATYSAAQRAVAVDGTNGVNGGVGSSAGNAGLFGAASGMAVAAGITHLTLAGHAVGGIGAGDYVFDGAVNAAYVTANPRTSFLAADGRGFKLDPLQRHRPEMFGDVSTAAAMSTALDAALEHVPATTTKYSGLVELRNGSINLSQTLEPDAVFNLKGHSTGYVNGGAIGFAATRLIFPVNTTGLRVRSAGTEGTGLLAGTTNAAGSKIEGIQIEQALDGSGNLGTDREAHGIHCRGTLIAKHISIDNVAGDGINITASFDGGASTVGNANNWFLESCSVHYGAGNGLRVGRTGGVTGAADTNAGLAIHLYIHQVARAGIIDYSYYGNQYISPQINASGNNGVHHAGAIWQLNVESNVGGEPGVFADWYKLKIQAAPDVNFPAWSATTTYYSTIPMLVTSPSLVTVPYQENQRTLAHIPNGIVIAGNMGVTQQTPRVEGKFNVGFVCNMGVGHFRSTGGDTNHPAWAFIGPEEYTYIGTPSDTIADLHKRAYIMRHRVNGFEWSIGYENVVSGVERDIVSRYAGAIQWSISGKGTARTYGRSAAVEGMFTAHDMALQDPNDSANARIIGYRAAAPTTGYHARGEFRFNVNPSATGTLGWSCAASGTPGTWVAVPVGTPLGPTFANGVSAATFNANTSQMFFGFGGNPDYRQALVTRHAVNLAGNGFDFYLHNTGDAIGAVPTFRAATIDDVGFESFGRVKGTQFTVGTDKVVGARGAAVTDPAYSAAAPTKAEFDALVDTVRALLARLRAATGHGLIA